MYTKKGATDVKIARTNINKQLVFEDINMIAWVTVDGGREGRVYGRET